MGQSIAHTATEINEKCPFETKICKIFQPMKCLECTFSIILLVGYSLDTT